MMVVLMCGFASCNPDNPQESEATLTPEQIELQDRTEEEIIASVSDEPYENLITAQTNHKRIGELISAAKYYGGRDTAPDGLISLDITEYYPLELTLVDINKQFPIQCLRKSGDGRYYAIYLNEYGDPFYLCFKKVQTDAEEDKWEYLLHRWLMVPTIDSYSFEKGKTTIEDYLKKASYNIQTIYSKDV